MNCFIGLDIGTSAVKGAAMSEDGKVLGTVTGKYDYYGEDGQRLLNPQEFTDACFSVIKELASTYCQGYNVAAICECCASGNLILLDNEDKPITPIIGWQTKIEKEDRDHFFTDAELDELYKTVGWRLGLGFPVGYLAAIKLRRPDLLDNTKTIAMSAEYLNFCLTGEWGIAHSMGTPFYLLDQEKGVYNQPLLEKLEIADKNLPPIYNKGTAIGTLLPEIAKELGLSADTKVVLGSFDHPSGATGAGVYEEGEMLLSCGTSWVEFFPVATRVFAISTKSLVDRFMLSGSPYCVMKSVASISAKIDALRKHYLGHISHKEFDRLCEGSKLGCNGLVFSFTDEDFKLDKEYEKCDIARAIIESAALKLKENLAVARECGLRADKITMIGGITNSATCVKIVAEVLGQDITVVNGQAAGAVGACMLAGIGVGVYKDEKDAFNKTNFPKVTYSCK